MGDKSAVAFIGLGNMGRPMAANLLGAGHAVLAFDLAADAVQSLAAEGAHPCTSALDAAAGADVLISMLPEGRHVQALYGEIMQAMPGKLAVDCSTIDARVAAAVAKDAKAAGVRFVDAPVSGGIKGARDATLSFMCGGSEQAVAAARPVLGAMGRHIFHAGPSGAGQVAKMCNNMLLAIIMIGTTEALALGRKCGLDAATLSDIMQASTGRNWALETYNPCPGVMADAPAGRGYAPGFMVDLMCKDLGLAMANVEAQGVNAQLGRLATDIYGRQQDGGQGALDFSSVYKHLHGDD